MQKRIIIISMVLFFSMLGFAQQKQSTSIDYIFSGAMVLDEWKKPGLYSPVNMFDGDMGTCYAEGLDDGYDIAFEIYFDKPVYIDEIRVVNGFAKNDEYFYNNNRARSCNISMKNTKKNNETSSSEYFLLQDTKEYQSIKLKKAYLANTVQISTDCTYVQNCQSIYPGKKYNDTCITELEFFYQGQKIELLDIPKFKKDYVIQLNESLVKAFSGMSYFISFYDETAIEGSKSISLCSMVSKPDGTIKYLQVTENKYFKGDVKDYMPDMWKVEGSKLYMRLRGEWKPYKYYFARWSESPKDIYLFTMPFEGLPAGGYFWLQR